MGENQFFIDSKNLSKESLERKHRLENDPSSRANHMDYLEGMEVISSDIFDKVLVMLDKNYSWTKF